MGNSQPSTCEPILLAGPTAVGKTEVTVILAEKISGEIISVDSMQVYRGMDIGTAKPSAELRARFPHHLIDIAAISQAFDAAQFVRLAREAISQIQSAGKTPILCGGTGLYFKALLDGLGQAPPSDTTLRAQLEATPLADLLNELGAKDPITFEKIDRKNPRRIIRAIEVIRLTGKPFSAQRADWSHASQITNERSPLAFGLSRSPADLHSRIDARVQEMFRSGLVAETEALLKSGLRENKTATQALGYRQVIEYLDGKRSLPNTIELVKIRTRQFAKRQMTWFRRQMNLQWIQIAPKESPLEISERLVLQCKPT